MNIELNGVDPSGDSPPDEIIHRADGGNTELIRFGDGYSVRLYHADNLVLDEPHKNFEDAFNEFAASAHRMEES